MAAVRDARYDVVVVGAGAAGLGAAREARRRGARPVVVVDGPIGGECTFSGCVPSKALILAAGRGASFAEAMVSLRTAVERIARAESADVLLGEGIDVIEGRARLVAPDAVEVGGRIVRGRGVVLATGSAPAIPTIAGLGEAGALTNETVFGLATLPRSLVIIGGGAVGCELAQAFARFGSTVTVIETASRLVASEEEDASAVVAAALGADGVDVRLAAAPESVERSPGGGVGVTLKGGTSVTAEHVLVAAGRRAVTAGLGLDEAGVAVDERGIVITDRHLATSVRGVYAAGDVTGRLQLTHAANRMGALAAGNVLRRFPRASFAPDAIPAVIFTDPQVARVGITERDAGGGALVAELPMAEFDRAVIEERTEGFIKLIAAPRRLFGHRGGGRVVGATVVAPGAGEMIHEVVFAVRTGAFTGRLVQTVHAYPTWSLAVQTAAAQFFFEIGGRRARPARIHDDERMTG